jgi:predicted phosphodiesterase/biotin operon repressor
VTNKIKSLEELLRKSPVSYDEIKKETGITKKQLPIELNLLKEKGVPISSYVNQENYTTFFYIQKGIISGSKYEKILLDGDYSFLLVSDTHMGDKSFSLDNLLDAYDKANTHGVECAFHAGDLMTGVDVYPSQHADLLYHTYDDQIDYVVNNYPQLNNGKKTLFIAGNHDLKQIKYFDPCVVVGNKREDMTYLGQAAAQIKLANGLKVDLCHYKGSMAWSLGYRAQKYIRELPPPEMPEILLLGHKHVTMYANVQGVHAFECGTFQGPNTFTKERGLTGPNSAWILDVTIEDGALKKLLPELIVYH